MVFMEDDLLQFGKNFTSRDAKWNIFKFQDHLLDWISASAQLFQARRYSESFEAITNVYVDSYGFFSTPEQKEIDEMFKNLMEENSKFINYNEEFKSSTTRNGKQGVYNPPCNIYMSLLLFRKKLMGLMTKHQLLIPMVDKSGAGAGSA